jgi:hypothetical protein
VASAPSAAIAFKGAAPTLPIVCLGLTDAGIPRLFASYAHCIRMGTPAFEIDPILIMDVGRRRARR